MNENKKEHHLHIVLTTQQYTGKVGAVRQHIKITITQLRRPLGSLFLKGRHADKAHGLVILLCDIDDFPGVQSHAGVTGNLKFCHSTLTQFHNTLSQFQFHSAALGIFFIKAPRKPHGMLTYDRTTVLFFHIPTSFYVVYWLTICILTAAIFRVNRNVSYKHTK